MNKNFIHFISDENREAFDSLMEKLSKSNKPGRIIPVTSLEQRVLRTMISVPDDQGSFNRDEELWLRLFTAIAGDQISVESATKWANEGVKAFNAKFDPPVED